MGKVPWDIPLTFPQRSLQIHLCTLHHTLTYYIWMCILLHSFVWHYPFPSVPLGGSSWCCPLKVDLNATFTTNVIETFTKTLRIRYHHVDVTVVVLVVVGVIVPLSCFGPVYCLYLWLLLVLSLLRAHVGYFHLKISPLMCSPSLCSSYVGNTCSSPMCESIKRTIVVAVAMQVLLNAGRFSVICSKQIVVRSWWNFSVPKRTEPSLFGISWVNWMYGSMELMWCRNWKLCSAFEHSTCRLVLLNIACTVTF